MLFDLLPDEQQALVSILRTASLSSLSDYHALHPNLPSRSTSSFNRDFIAATTALLNAFSGRSLAGLNVARIVLDGTPVDDEIVVWALGITTDGVKVPLTIAAEGRGESTELVLRLLQGLTDRGLDTRNVVWSVDGGQGLGKAIELFTLGDGAVQRCRVHKVRNILTALPPTVRAEIAEEVIGRAWKAWGNPDYDAALADLEGLAAWLEGLGQEAAAESAREGAELTLTLQRLRIQERVNVEERETDELLEGTNNVIESAHTIVSSMKGRPKTWKDSEMRLRWVAAGVANAERNWALAGARPKLERESLSVTLARHSSSPDWATLSDTGTVTVTRVPTPPGHERETFAAIRDLARWADDHDKVVEIDEQVLGELPTAATLRPWLVRCGFELDHEARRHVRASHVPDAMGWAEMDSGSFTLDRLQVPTKDADAARALATDALGVGADGDTDGVQAVCLGSGEALGKLGLEPGRRLTTQELTVALQGKAGGRQVRSPSSFRPVADQGELAGTRTTSVVNLPWELKLPLNVKQRWRDADPEVRAEIEAAVLEGAERAVKRAANADAVAAAITISVQPTGRARRPQLRVRGVIFGVMQEGKLRSPLTNLRWDDPLTKHSAEVAALASVSRLLESELSRLGPAQDLESLRVVAPQGAASPTACLQALGEVRGGWIAAQVKDAAGIPGDPPPSELRAARVAIEDPFQHLDLDAAANALQWERQRAEAQKVAEGHDNAARRAQRRVDELDRKLDGLRESERHPDQWMRHRWKAVEMLVLDRELARQSPAPMTDRWVAILLRPYRELLGERRVQEVAALAKQRAHDLSSLPEAELLSRRAEVATRLRSIDRGGASETVWAERTRVAATERLRAATAEAAALERSSDRGERKGAKPVRRSIEVEQRKLDDVDARERRLRGEGIHLDDWMRESSAQAAELVAIQAALNERQRGQETAVAEASRAQRTANQPERAAAEQAAVGMEM